MEDNWPKVGKRYLRAGCICYSEKQREKTERKGKEKKTKDRGKELTKQRTKKRGEEMVSGGENSRIKRKVDGVNIKVLFHLQILRFHVPSKGDQKIPLQSIPQELAQDYSELKTSERKQIQEALPILANVPKRKEEIFQVIMSILPGQKEDDVV